MLGIDKARVFKPVNIALLTVSDTRTIENDKSGDTLQERILQAGHNVYDRYIVNPHKRQAETKPGYIPGAPSQELVREDLAIHAITNRSMIESVGTDSQRRILADVDSRYPAGSPAREALRQAALSGTYAAPDAKGNIVRQPARNVPASAKDKIERGFGPR